MGHVGNLPTPWKNVWKSPLSLDFLADGTHIAEMDTFFALLIVFLLAAILCSVSTTAARYLEVLKLLWWRWFFWWVRFDVKVIHWMLSGIIFCLRNAAFIFVAMLILCAAWLFYTDSQPQPSRSLVAPVEVIYPPSHPTGPKSLEDIDLSDIERRLLEPSAAPTQITPNSRR